MWPARLPWFTRRREHPLLRENREYFSTFDQSGPIADYQFAVVDTELTGLNRRRDEIVSIGIVKIEGLRIRLGHCFHTLVKPQRPIPKDSTLIHRITPQLLEQAPALEEVLEGVVEFLDHCLIVGHYVGLDISFLNRAVEKHLGGRLHNPCIDTLKLAQVYQETMWENYYDQFNYSVSYSLSDLARQHGLPEFPAHDAMSDALQAAYLFLFLVKKLDQGRLRTLRDLYLAGRSWRWIF